MYDEGGGDEAGVGRGINENRLYRIIGKGGGQIIEVVCSLFWKVDGQRAIDIRLHELD